MILTSILNLGSGGVGRGGLTLRQSFF